MPLFGSNGRKNSDRGEGSKEKPSHASGIWKISNGHTKSNSPSNGSVRFPNNDRNRTFDYNAENLEISKLQLRTMSGASGLHDHSAPRLVFHCQQAQGSPTGLISGFSNVKQLYQKIAECYDFPENEILFCTLNTHKVDMSKLLGGQIGLDDFIFVHRKGRPKEIEIKKTEEALGLTITDNGVGYSFIKRIKEGSVIHKIAYINVGDHIEKINNESMIGRRHFEVAKLLKNIPVDEVFTIRLVEPLKAGFSNIEPRSNYKKGKKAVFGTGKETLRFKADGTVQIEEVNGTAQLGINKINELLENFLGISDDELAISIWELSDGKVNSMEFAEAIDGSDLEELGFCDDFIIELWGIITDVRSGRTIK